MALDVPVDEGSPETILGVTGLALGLGGAVARARSNLSTLRERRAGGDASLFWPAVIHLGLGEIDEGFRLLETAFERREGNLLYLAVVPEIPGFQSDPRFGALLRRMGLGHLLHDAAPGR